MRIRTWLALAVNEGRFYCRPTLWKQTQERGLKSALIRFWGCGYPPLSGIDSIHDRPRMKPIAVEAFGRHLKGADASVPFSFGGFFGNSGKTQWWDLVYTVSIPFRWFSRASSQQYASYPARVYLLKKCARRAKGERDSPAGTGLSIRLHLRCPRLRSVTT